MKKVNIIGAGIAGLSAGCYLQMNGYDTQIYELHNLPGGLCTSWKRKQFTIDNCIHWLVGSGPSDKFYNLWNELIDMQGIEFVDFEEWIRVEGNDGRFITVYNDVDRLKTELLLKAPEDAELITEFTGAIKRFMKLNLPIEKASETYGPFDRFKLMFQLFPYLRQMKRWSRVSLQGYAERCKDPLLSKTFRNLFLPETQVLFIIMGLVWANRKSAGYPIGGSLEFARLIEKSYLELGGKVNYKSKVVKIMTENDSARGIMLENQEVHDADIVISAADGHYTIFEMLDGKYVDQEIQNYYQELKTFPSYALMSLGVSRTFENEPHTVILPLDKPITIDEGTVYEEIFVRIFNFDNTLAPEGKTLITALIPTYEYEYWCNLKENNIGEYQRQKERIANEVIQILERRFGNVQSNTEMIDVSTPSTVLRYTNNWKGSLEGWLMTPNVAAFSGLRKTLPGLKDFYMAGQWVEPGGGLPSALLSGRNLTQIICKRDKKKFITRKVRH
jgi:phytoene dehydrogenase-like protein